MLSLILKYRWALLMALVLMSWYFVAQNVTDNTVQNLQKKNMNWLPLTEESQIANITQASFKHPVMIFKHSTTCSISATAKSRLERNWKEDEIGNMQVYYLDLLRFRNVSNQVTKTFGIEHESPQVLIIENGKCVYNESHLGINFQEISGLAMSAEF